MMLLCFNAELEAGPHEDRLLQRFFYDNHYFPTSRPVADDSDSVFVKFAVTQIKTFELVSFLHSIVPSPVYILYFTAIPSMVPVLSSRPRPNASFHYQYQSVSAHSSCHRCPSRFSARSDSVHCIQQTSQIPFLLITSRITCLQMTLRRMTTVWYLIFSYLLIIALFISTTCKSLLLHTVCSWTPQKTEFIWFGTCTTLPKIPAAYRSLPVGSAVRETVRDLGVWFDSELSMKKH